MSGGEGGYGTHKGGGGYAKYVGRGFI